MNWLRRRGDAWFFRRIVPAAYKQALLRSVVERTLETRSHRQASVRATACWLVTDAAIELVKAGRADDGRSLLTRMSSSAPWLVSLVAQQQQPPEAAADGCSLTASKPAPPSRAIPSRSTGVTDSARSRSAGGPRFSEHLDAFIAEKSRSTGTHTGYSAQTVQQTRATFRLWMELVCDIPVHAITGAVAGRFRDDLLRLPASHGKGRRETARAAIERIDADAPDTPRLSMKTVKRHFSSLSQYADWLLQREHVAKNPFTGFDFPGTGASTAARDMWSDADLLTLLSGPWLRGEESRHLRMFGEDAIRWIPLIGMFTGMRLEEICRLRAGDDIVDIDGVLSFLVQDQPALDGLEPWSPKSTAGERVVPVHPHLIELGLPELVERRRAAGDVRLFPSLQPTGPDRKLGSAFSREFSRMKAALRVGGSTTFHSLRHNVSTILRNRETGIREPWIDAVLGHESGSRSQGIRTYLKSVGVRNLATTVAAIEYSGDVVAATDRLAATNR